MVCRSALLATQCLGIQQCLSVLARAGSLVGLGFFGGLPSSLERVANCVWLRRTWGVRLCSKQRFRDLCCLFLREFNLIAGRARPSVDQIMVGRSDGNFGIVGLIAQIRDIWLVLPLSQQADAFG